MDGPSAPPLTQAGKSKVKYAWVFLFENNINVEEPFKIVPLSLFSEVEDFPWSFIEGEMSSECRAEIRKFDNMTGDFRIFGKIEKG